MVSMGLSLFVLGMAVICLLAAPAMVWGRKVKVSRQIVIYGLPAAMLLTILTLWLGRGELDRFFIHEIVLSFGLAPVVAVGTVLGFAFWAAAGAVFAAFCPGKPAFLLAACLGLAGTGISFFEFLLSVRAGALAGCCCYALVWLLGCMGLALPRKKVMPDPGTAETGTVMQERVLPAGFLLLLSEPFKGGKLPVPAGEELRMGRDAAYCHLIMDLPEMPPCLCGVRWLEQRNTYLITCYADDGLLYEDGQPLPVNCSVEAKPGQTFFCGPTGQALFQTG